MFESLLVDVREEHKRRLEVIHGEDYSGVVRKVREFYVAEHGYEPTQQYLESGVYGLKQYYAVALLDPLNAHAVSAKIDPFWHAHILHTQQYMDFCDKAMGKYVHHVPLDPDNKGQVENLEILYTYTREIVEQLFGIADSENWPTDGMDFRLICFHARGYPEVDHLGLFPESEKGVAYAF